MNRREALVEMAIQRGLDADIAYSALNNPERETVSMLFEQMQKASDSFFIIPKYAEEVIRSTQQNKQLLEIGDLLLTISYPYICFFALHLSYYGAHPKAISLLRQIAIKHICGAEEIFDVLYDKGKEALDDETDLVRVVAVRHFEKIQDTEFLIKALSNDVPQVRVVAAWYMGRKKVSHAIDNLHKLLQHEQDIETLRAVIWSLGVLKAVNVKSELEKFLYHENPLISNQTQETLKHFK